MELGCGAVEIGRVGVVGRRVYGPVSGCLEGRVGRRSGCGAAGVYRLSFVDDVPRAAEVLSMVVLLASVHLMQYPMFREQQRV